MLILGVVTVIFGMLPGASPIGPLLIAKGAGVSTKLFKASVFLPFLGLCLVFAFWAIFIQLALTISVIRPVGTKLKEIFQEAWKKFGQYLWIVILEGFSVFLAGLLFLIPGIIVGVYLTFHPYVFVAEGKKGMNVLERSWALVKGSWWKVFGRLVLLVIVFSIIFFLSNFVHSLLSTIFQFFFKPFSTIFFYLIYQDLKKSKEIQVQ